MTWMQKAVTPQESQAVLSMGYERMGGFVVLRTRSSGRRPRRTSRWRTG